MAIVNKICADNSTDCRGLSLSGMASDLLNAVGIDPYLDIFEIPVHSDSQVCICFWFNGEPFELWAGLSYDTKEFFTECRRWSEDANGEIIDFSIFAETEEEPTEEEAKEGVTVDQVDKYREEHGERAALDLLYLLGPDHFSGDYETAVSNLKVCADRQAVAQKEREKRERKQAETNRENFERCRSIADELTEVAEGVLYKCPHCGEWYSIEDAAETEDGHICPNCSEEIEDSEAEQVTFFDYFEDVYDIEYKVDGNGDYRAVRLMVACGGPNIYIDTASASVDLYWWTDRASAYFDRSTADEIDAVFQELYEMR